MITKLGKNIVIGLRALSGIFRLLSAFFCAVGAAEGNPTASIVSGVSYVLVLIVEMVDDALRSQS
jgi:hypothetical protein